MCDLLPLSGAQPWGWEVSLSLPFLPKVLSSPTHSGLQLWLRGALTVSVMTSEMTARMEGPDARDEYRQQETA